MAQRTCSYKDCQNPVHARSWCSTHYKRWRLHGDPGYHDERSDPSLAVRLWSRVDKRGPDECWLWEGKVNNTGYGAVGFNHQVIGAHRAAWIVSFGDIPEGLFVCHRCDEPRCCNPSHLWLGSAKHNTADMMAKKRHVPVRGEAHGQAILTDDVVRAIRAKVQEGYTRREVGAMFGIDHGHVTLIVQRKVWGHVV